MNLWAETERDLIRLGKSWDDVVAVVGNCFRISKEQFKELALKTDYDNSWGAPEVATDLKIIGSDFWLERYEYDGSEWWEYKTMPNINLPLKSVKRLSISGTLDCGWMSLDELNGGTNE